MIKTKRPPIVAVLGHIDHGKSTLLDYIRKTNVALSEAGGITQRLSAYEVVHTTKEGVAERITFLDTPGHAAFSRMRLRGAEVADIAILVVSAEEGVKPQTLEALRVIREADIPYVVAVNKIDKPEANIERTKQNLAENEVYLEGYGGSVPWVPVSAKRGDGIPDLLDVLLLLAELEELKGDPAAEASGSIIEVSVDKRGIGATLLVTDGTIRKGECVVAGESFSPVRIMEDFAGKPITEATFSSPVRVVGFSSIPAVGSRFDVVDSKKQAEARVLAARDDVRVEQKKETEEARIVLPLVIKADAASIVEAIEQEVAKIPQEKIVVKIVAAGTGAISESDVKAAGASSRSIIVGFNVRADARARELAERLGITIMTFDVIYKLTEWLAEAVKERTPKQKVEEVSAHAKVLKVFNQAKGKIILGGRVQSGALNVNDAFRIVRRDATLGEGKVVGLQQQKKDVKNVESGLEFGAEVKTGAEVAPGDVLEVFVTVMK